MTDTRSLLLLEVDRHRCAIPGESVEQVLRACAVAPLSGAPAFVQGAINLRGEILPVVDLRQRLGMPARPLHPSEHFVIVTVRGHRLVLRVDRAVDLVAVAAEHVRPPHELSPRSVAGALAMDGGVLFIHDVQQFLTEAEEADLRRLLGDSSS